MSRFQITPAIPGDDAFIRDSWRESYRESPGTGRWPRPAYDSWISQHVSALLPRCSIIVARPVDWSEGIIGWVATEQQRDAFCVHYTFVRPLFRQQGALRAMLDSIPQKSGALIFSALRPPYSDALKHLGYAFDRHASK